MLSTLFNVFAGRKQLPFSATLRRKIALVFLLSALVLWGCSSESPETDDRCPAGHSYDAERDRCVDDDANAELDADVGKNDVRDADGGELEVDVGDTAVGGEDTGEDAEDIDASPQDTDGAEVGEPDGGTGEIPGECSGSGLAGDFAAVAVPNTASSVGDRFAAAAPDDGAFIAQHAGDSIEVIQTRADGSVVDEHTFDGDGLYGLATSQSQFALLVFRQSDVLTLIVVDHDGTLVEERNLIGDVDQSEIGNTWFGTLIRDGRLTEADGQWAAYYTIQERRSDGVAHYGDQLRLFDADGSPEAGGWDWGCSHSMEVRISHNGERLGPLCASDCYPSKGVHYNHNSGELWSDEEASDCAGGYGTTLGDSVPTDDGFWMAFTATDERQSHDVAINRVTGFSASSEDTQWLTDDDVDAQHLRAASYGADHLLVAWTTGVTFSSDGTTHFTVVDDADGSVVMGPEEIPDASLEHSSDFFSYTNGDVGWVQPSDDGGLELARLQICP